MRSVTLSNTILALSLFFAESATAKVFLTVEEGLGLAFRDCEVRKETLYLTPEQAREVERLSGVAKAPRLVVRHHGTCDKAPARSGRAYIDTRTVKTRPQTLLVIVNEASEVERVEVLSFEEPSEYMPSGTWYAVFRSKKLGEGLALKREIPFVTGATLTARASIQAARLALAYDRVMPKTPPGKR